MTLERWLPLKCHPLGHCEAVRAIQVQVRRSTAAEIQITFRLDGDLERLRIPPPRAPRFATDLWRHTCFEAFIAIEGQTAYCEFNFAPSGEWAVYGFADYRDGGPITNEDLRPLIAVRSTQNRLELDSVVRLDNLSPTHSEAALRVGLCAVVEDGDGFSYWALRHPIAKPDFHNAGGFTLALEPSGLRG
jgi:hypothetical protein